MNDKEKALNEALKKIEKAGLSVYTHSTESKPDKIASISTGSLGLDDALGIGGFPRGRITELFGNEGSGKSTLALLGIANTQKNGGNAVLIDAEHSYSESWSQNMGVDTKKLTVIQPDYGEQALEAVSDLASSCAVDMIVIDSTAALVPKSEYEATMEENSVGLQARLLSKGLRKLIGPISKTNTAVIFINQLRENIGVMFGNPEVTPGGRALKFYSSVRLQVNKMSGKDNVYKDESEKIIGHKIRVKVVKNKCATPFRECEFDFYFAKGIDIVSEIPKLSLSKKIVALEGKTYTFKEQKWIGYDNFVSAIKQDPNLQNQLKKLINNVDKKS